MPLSSKKNGSLDYSIVSLMHREPLFGTWSKKRLGELEVFIKKNKTKRCSYVQKKKGEIVIKNSEWVYISIKKNHNSL